MQPISAVNVVSVPRDIFAEFYPARTFVVQTFQRKCPRRSDTGEHLNYRRNSGKLTTNTNERCTHCPRYGSTTSKVVDRFPISLLPGMVLKACRFQDLLVARPTSLSDGCTLGEIAVYIEWRVDAERFCRNMMCSSITRCGTSYSENDVCAKFLQECHGHYNQDGAE